MAKNTGQSLSSRDQKLSNELSWNIDFIGIRISTA